MLTATQLKERQGYIGGSDAAGVLGLSRWATPLGIWAEKTGQYVQEVDSLAAKLGQKLEQAVADLFMEETGKKVHKVNETKYHAKYPFLACNIDRRVVGENAILECKTASAWKAKEWDGEEIPREYILQVMHMLAVTGAQCAYIAVLIGNQDFKWKTIWRDEKALADMVKKEVAFWNDFVVPKVMPAVVSWKDKDPLNGLFPVATDETVTLDDTANAIAEVLEGMEADYGNLGAQIEKSKNELKALMGKAAKAETDHWTFSWTNVPEKRIEAFTKKAHRRFNTKRKGESKNGANGSGN